MRRNQTHPQIGQRRRSQHRQHDIRRRHRQAHAQNQRRNGDKHNRNKHTASGNRRNQQRKFDPNANHQHHTHNNPRAQKNNSGRNHIVSTQRECIDNIADIHARILIQPTRNNNTRGSGCRGKCRCKTIDQRTHQHHNGNRKMPAISDRIPDIRNFRSRQRHNPPFSRAKMDKKGDTQKIDQRGDKRHADNGQIGNLRPLTHNKRARAHNRRHELTARRCRRLNRA